MGNISEETFFLAFQKKKRKKKFFQPCKTLLVLSYNKNRVGTYYASCLHYLEVLTAANVIRVYFFYFFYLKTYIAAHIVTITLNNVQNSENIKINKSHY